MTEEPTTKQHRRRPTAADLLPSSPSPMRMMAALLLTVVVSSSDAFVGVASAFSTTTPSSIIRATAGGSSSVLRSSSSSRRRSSTMSPLRSTTQKIEESATTMEDDDEMEAMRREIEEMKSEALKRIDALLLAEEGMNGAASVVAKKSNGRSSSSSSSSSSSTTIVAEAEKKIVVVAEGEEAQGAASIPASTAAARERAAARWAASVAGGDGTALLDGTRWKVALSIGREPGTWMPKTWGISGDRLNLNLELDFTSSQLYDREDFLNGLGGSKICHVVNNELTLGPSLTEGSRTYRVRDGGWRIGQNEGPLGTDLLRFYVEVDEEIRHSGGDVYCPAGRIYCTCGYFPTKKHRRQLGESLDDDDEGFETARESLQKQLNDLVSQADRIEQQIDSERNPLSIRKFKLTRKLFQLRVDAGRVHEQLNVARVRDPDKSILRMSKNDDVGLTREGGVCCKVNKGVSIEYHILGKFAVASVEPNGDDEQQQR